MSWREARRYRDAARRGDASCQVHDGRRNHTVAPMAEDPGGRVPPRWEQRISTAVADVFGFHALQLGLPELEALGANRMPHRWLAVESPPLTAEARAEAAATEPEGGGPAKTRVALHCHFDALPFESASLDLVVLPHSLELATAPASRGGGGAAARRRTPPRCGPGGCPGAWDRNTSRTGSRTKPPCGDGRWRGRGRGARRRPRRPCRGAPAPGTPDPHPPPPRPPPGGSRARILRLAGPPALRPRTRRGRPRSPRSTWRRTLLPW